MLVVNKKNSFFFRFNFIVRTFVYSLRFLTARFVYVGSIKWMRWSKTVLWCRVELKNLYGKRTKANEIERKKIWEFYYHFEKSLNLLSLSHIRAYLYVVRAMVYAYTTPNLTGFFFNNLSILCCLLVWYVYIHFPYDIFVFLFSLVTFDSAFGS